MDWTEQEEADLYRIWFSGENLKKNLHLFGDRSYMTVVSHAHMLEYGPRPHTNRGVVPFARETVLDNLKKFGPGVIPELAERTRLTKQAITKYFKPKFAGPKGDFHIVDWRRRPQGGAYIPVYAFGPGQNAVRPAPRTNAELCRVQNQRNREKRIAAGERPRFVNPFATAAGLVQAPIGKPGRVFQQDMSVDEWPQSRRAA